MSNEIEENSSFLHTTPQTPSLFFSLASINVLWYIDSYILSAFHAVTPLSSPSFSLRCYGKARFDVFNVLDLITTPQRSLNWQEAKYLYTELTCCNLISKEFDHSFTDIWVMLVNAEPTRIYIQTPSIICTNHTLSHWEGWGWGAFAR